MAGFGFVMIASQEKQLLNYLCAMCRLLLQQVKQCGATLSLQRRLVAKQEGGPPGPAISYGIRNGLSQSFFLKSDCTRPFVAFMACCIHGSIHKNFEILSCCMVTCF